MKLHSRETLYCLGLLLGSLLFCAGMTELGIRLFAPQIFAVYPNGLWQLSPTLGCRLTPGFDGTHELQEFRVRVTISPQGLRDREYGPKRPGTVRILALGDSFTFGFGVEENEAYPKQLEQLLRANHSGHDYEVINTGAPGYGTHQERQYLNEQGLAYQPDLILIGFFVANDLKENLLAPNRFMIVSGYLYEKQGYEQALKRRHQQFGRLPIPFKDALWAHSHAYRFLADRYHRLLARFDPGRHRVEPPPLAPRPAPMASLAPPTAPVIDHEIFEVTERLLLGIAETAWKHHAAVALILIPDIKQVANPGGQWRAVWEELTTFATEHHIPVIDLAPAFLEESQAGHTKRLWFMFNQHWRTAGHRLAATLIYRALVQQRLIPL